METTASLWTDLTADKGGTVYDSDSALLTTDYSALLTNSALENKSETVGRIFRAGEMGGFVGVRNSLLPAFWSLPFYTKTLALLM